MIALALMLVAALAVGYQSYRAIDRELTAGVVSKNAALAELASVTLSEKLDRLIDIGVSLADRVRFRELIAAGRWTEAMRILDRVRAEFPFIDRLLLTDVSGTLMADIPAVPEVAGQNFSHRDWYRGVSREMRPYISNVYRRAAAPARNVFGVAVPIRDKDGNALGFLLLQVRLDTLFEWARSVDVGDEGYLYVVDRAGRVAFHPRLSAENESVDLSAVPAVGMALAGRKGAEIGAAPGAARESVTVYEPVRRYGWAVVAEQSASAAFAAKDQQLRRLLVAYGLTALFCAMAVYLAARVAAGRRQAEEDRRAKAELEQLVTERTAELVEANQVLRASEKRYSTLFETMDEGFCVIEMINDPDGKAVDYRFVEINPAFMKHTGLADALSKTMREMVPNHDEHWFEIYGKVARTGESIRFENPAVAMQRHYDVFAFRVGGDGSQRVGIFFSDITRRKRAEDEILALNAMLEKRSVLLEGANKELESFSYSVSHDLRAPLRAIGGFARILEEDYGAKLDEEGRRLLAVVRDNSRKMGELIDDLLEFSRLGRKALSAAEIDMRRLVEDTLGEIRTHEEKAPGVVLGTLPPARGDPILLKQAWVNLLGNAIKFSSKREQPVVEVSGRENGVENIYCVKDNGAGFDMRYYDKLFGVFHRLHTAEEFPGTGVGLAIVQRVVARHGGRVWAEGKLGEGATFYFSLPKERRDG